MMRKGTYRGSFEPHQTPTPATEAAWPFPLHDPSVYTIFEAGSFPFPFDRDVVGGAAGKIVAPIGSRALPFAAAVEVDAAGNADADVEARLETMMEVVVSCSAPLAADARGADAGPDFGPSFIHFRASSTVWNFL